jgi:hypothetical protein
VSRREDGGVLRPATPDRSQRRIAAVIAVATAGALAVLAVAHTVFALTRDYEDTSDWASIEMRTRDVFSAHPPLIGAWSRYEWSHPGPLLFYVLAIPYRLLGSSWRTLWIGAILVNVAAVALAVWLAARRSTGFGGAMLLAALATIASFRPHLLSDPWNATIVILPVLLVVAAAVATRSDDPTGVPVLVLSYMFVAQCHFGFGVVLLPVTAWAVVHAARGPQRRRTLIWTGVGVAMWLPVAIDTVANWPGNFLRSIWWNLTADEPPRGFGEALRVFGRTGSLTFLRDPGVPSFDVVIDHPAWGTFPFAVLFALVAGWLVARRIDALTERRAVEVLGLVWATGFVAVARVKGPLLRWIIDWTYPLTALSWMVVVLVAYRWLRWIVRERATLSSVTRWAGVAAFAVASTAFVATNIDEAIGAPYVNEHWFRIARQFAAAAQTAAAPDGRVFVDIEGELRLAGAVQSGMINLLEHRGFDANARLDQGLQFGPARHDDGTSPRVIVRTEATSDPPPNATLLSLWEPLTGPERSEADRLTRELRALMIENGLADKVPVLDTEIADLAAYGAPPAVTARLEEFRRLAELRRRGARVALYLVPR